MEDDILFYKKFDTSSDAKIIYLKEDNGIITEPDYITHFTLMIGSGYLGFDINLDNMQLMSISGYFPRSIWNLENIYPPETLENGGIFIETNKKWSQGMGTYLAKEMPIYFCDKNNWVCIGEKEHDKYDCCIRFMENAIICLKNNRFKALWFTPVYR